MRSSVDVGTAERVRLSSKRSSCLGIIQLRRSGVDHMLYGKTGELAEIIDDVNVKTIPIRYC